MTALAERPVLELPRLRVDQSAIARHPAKTKVIAAGRRFGKSTLGMVLALACAAAGGRVAWVVPTYRNGRPLWRAAKAAAARLGTTEVRIGETDRTIEFRRSLGFLAIYSADSADSIRGEAFNLVIVDEAAMIAEDVWTDVIQPTLADADGDSILISTPKGRNWFWREFQRGLIDGVDVMSWTAPSSDNPSPQIQRAAARAQTRVPESTYRQEWLAEFIQDGANPFDPAWWDGKNRFDPTDPKFARQCIARYISWDTAMKDKDSSDYAAAIVVELMPDYRLHVVEVYRDKLAFPNLLEQIERLARKWDFDGKLSGTQLSGVGGQIVIEDKNSGTSAYQTLTSASADPMIAKLVVPFMPVGSKRQRAGQAGVWCKNDCIDLPHPGPSVPWLLGFEEELFSFSGAGDEGHDDQVDTFSQIIIFLERLLAEGFHARNEAIAVPQ